MFFDCLLVKNLVRQSSRLCIARILRDIEDNRLRNKKSFCKIMEGGGGAHHHHYLQMQVVIYCN